MNINFLSQHEVSHKKVLLRVDFNVSFNKRHKISDDTRIQQALPTIRKLLKQQNKLILISHLGEPKQRDKQFSLQSVVKDLSKYLPSYHIRLVDDFQKDREIFIKQQTQEILMLENIRFYPGEQANDEEFARELSLLGEIYVNDAFGVSHRNNASVTQLPKLLPAYGGLLMEKEINMLDKVIHLPKRPLVAIIGGSKISTKIKLIKKLIDLADTVLIGGGMANTFLLAENFMVGESLVEKDEVKYAFQLMSDARRAHKKLLLPLDAIVEDHPDHETSVRNVKKHDSIRDIGSETQAIFGRQISLARTIVWNGPVGMFEDNRFSRGTEYIYYAITQNQDAISIVGGGDTLAAINHKEYLDRITHISTGGGAMLEYIEKGTLPGIEALKH